MKSKPRKPVNGTLVKGTLVEVTDPAEFAALERRVQAALKAMAERKAPKKAKPRKRK